MYLSMFVCLVATSSARSSWASLGIILSLANFARDCEELSKLVGTFAIDLICFSDNVSWCAEKKSLLSAIALTIKFGWDRQSRWRRYEQAQMDHHSMPADSQR